MRFCGPVRYSSVRRRHPEATVAVAVYAGCCPEPATTGIHQDFLITSKQPPVGGER